MVCAGWENADTLAMNICLINTPHTLCARFVFEEERVTYTFDEQPKLNDSLRVIISFLSVMRPASERLAGMLGRAARPLVGRAVHTGE